MLPDKLIISPVLLFGRSREGAAAAGGVTKFGMASSITSFKGALRPTANRTDINAVVARKLPLSLAWIWIGWIFSAVRNSMMARCFSRTDSETRSAAVKCAEGPSPLAMFPAVSL